MSFSDLFKNSKERFFHALCQNEECKALVGGMHIPCTAGAVIFVCQRCGTVSEFVNAATRYETKVLGKVKVERDRERF